MGQEIQLSYRFLWYMLILWACIWSFLRRCTQKRNISLKERSVCDHCHKKLSRYELVPIISRLVQWWKCRICRQSISISYPLTELRSALIRWWAWWLQYTSIHLWLWNSIIFQLIITWLIYISMIDALYRELELSIYSVMTLFLLYLIFIYRDFIDVYTIIVRWVGWLIVWCLWWLIYKLKFWSWWQWVGFGDVLIGIVLWALISLLTTKTTSSIGTNSMIGVYFIYHLLISSSIAIIHQLLQGNTQKEFWFIPYMVTWFIILAIMILFFSDYIIIFW